MITLTSERLPIKIWANESDLEGFDNAIIQAKALANHPATRMHVALMPDFHVGYGMPIGGVMATEDAIIPNAVGVDIGCGMIAMQTDLDSTSITKDQLQTIRERIHQLVPVGNGPSGEHKNEFTIPTIHENTFLNQTTYIEKAKHQIGTLGGGNHFIELQHDSTNNQVWVMLHSGSRGLGAAVCKEYDNRAKAFNEMWYSNVPLDEHGHNELAFIPFGSPWAKAYIDEMKWCMEFAEISRNMMLQAVVAAINEVLVRHFTVIQVIETHHNYANLETHKGKQVWVHRKGAVRANQKVIIPGSMGTASYIAQGLDERESFGSCSHGGGRVMGRREANKTITHDQALESMKHVVFGVRQGDYEEMPAAYKNIDTVINNQLDLITPLHRLEPLAVVKG